MKEQLETVKTLLVCACLCGCIVNSCKQKTTSADLWALQNIVHEVTEKQTEQETLIKSVFSTDNSGIK